MPTNYPNSSRRHFIRQTGLSGIALTIGAYLPAIGGGVQKASLHLRAAQTFGAHQIVEGILNLGMQYVGQFVGEPTARGLIDEGLDSGNQSAVTGKPNCIVGPQADVVEAAFAGALGVRLGGPTQYHYELQIRPVLGDGLPPTVADLRRAVVSISPKGLKLIEAVAPSSEAIYAAITRRYGARKLAELQDMLHALEGRLSELTVVDEDGRHGDRAPFA